MRPVLINSVWLIAVVMPSVLVSSGSTQTKDVDSAVRKVLQDQVQAWNRGDIDGFMKGYWNSDRLTFSSGGTTTRGWQQTYDGYKLRYPSREKMGKLRFDQLEVMPICDDAALVLGRWHLERGKDSVGGNFSLVFRRLDGQWVIVHDHTSQAKE